MFISRAMKAIILMSAISKTFIIWRKKKKGRIIIRPTISLLTVFAMVFSIVTGLSAVGGCSSETPVTQYTLTINVEGNGNSAGAGTYDEGTVVSMSAEPDAEWEFVEWTGGIDTIGDHRSASTTVVMDRDYTITARFRLQPVTPTNISNVILNPPWPITLDYGEWVKFEFDYFIDERFPVYITPRPLSNGTLAPGYLAKGSTLFNLFSGKGEGEFTINPQSGQVVVDQIRFQIRPLYEGTILYEFFVPVNYTFQ